VEHAEPVLGHKKRLKFSESLNWRGLERSCAVLFFNRNYSAGENFALMKRQAGYFLGIQMLGAFE
jgi:hypothetical protein